MEIKVCGRPKKSLFWIQISCVSLLFVMAFCQLIPIVSFASVFLVSMMWFLLIFYIWQFNSSLNALHEVYLVLSKAGLVEEEKRE